MRRIAMLVPLVLAAALLPSARSGAVTSGVAVFAKDHADPEVIRGHDGRYYSFSTGRRNGSVRVNVPVLMSSDLTTWTEMGDALWSLGSWASTSPTWAPSVARIGEQYVLYYSAPLARTTPRQMCVGRAVSPTPNGPYTDSWRTPLFCPHDGAYEVIDPSVFLDSDGSVYLHYKTSTMVNGRNVTRIWTVLLSSDGTQLASEPEPLLDPTLAWEEDGVENPEMVLVDGTYWLLYSGSWWDTPRYATGIARCASAWGPCTKRGQLLVADDARNGTGGASLVQDAADRWWVVYHGWVARQRLAFVDAVDFTASGPVIDYERNSPRAFDVTGSLDAVVAENGHVRVTGWATDPDDRIPVRIDVVIDGVVKRTARADDYRRDLASLSAFDLSVALADGRTHTVCVMAHNDHVTPMQLGCRLVLAPTVASAL